MSSLSMSGLGHSDDAHGAVRCLPCHFSYEEEHAFKFLPPGLATKLLKDHREIMAQVSRGSLPLLALQAHATLENMTFKEWLPAIMYESLIRDHRECDRILLGRGEA